MPDNYEEKWTELKQWIINYNEERAYPDDYVGRYLVAISCEDLIDKMEEIESR